MKSLVEALSASVQTNTEKFGVVEEENSNLELTINEAKLLKKNIYDQLEEWYNYWGATGNVDILYNLVAKGKDDAVIAFLQSEGMIFDKANDKDVVDAITKILDI